MIKNVFVGLSQAIIWYFVGLSKGRKERDDAVLALNECTINRLEEQKLFYENFLTHWKLTSCESDNLEVGKEYLIMCGFETSKRLAVAKWMKFHGEEPDWYFDNREHSGWNYVRAHNVYAYAEMPFQPSEREIQLGIYYWEIEE